MLLSCLVVLELVANLIEVVAIHLGQMCCGSSRHDDYFVKGIVLVPIPTTNNGKRFRHMSDYDLYPKLLELSLYFLHKLGIISSLISLLIRGSNLMVLGADNAEGREI